MADRTEIAWTDSTFNPWIGCQKVGPGCDHCYAEREFDHRHHRAKWGPGQERVRTSVHNWRQPLRWNSKPFYECPACGWRGDDKDVAKVEHKVMCPRCFFGLNSARRRVFCASLSDVFDNAVPAQWRAELFALIEKTPNLDWLLLTKRIGNAHRMIEGTAFPSHRAWPWKNVWLGASICNQTEADRDIPKLLAVPAAIRFISMEPLLSAVDASRYLERSCCGNGRWSGHPEDEPECCCDPLPPLDWVIVGGESGPKARPMHPDWVYRLHDQCEAAGVPFLMKQWGEWVSAGARAFGTASGEVRHIRSDGSFWDEDDDALKDENADVLTVARVGKKAAGRDLHGEIHNEFPEVAHD